MIIRDFEWRDQEEVNAIFALYWNDQEFLEELSSGLKMAIDLAPEYIQQNWKFFVAVDNSEVVGVAAMRNASDYMKEFATTSNPAEFYVLASKYKGKGIGEALRVKRMEEAKKSGYTEIVFYSPNTHQDSWEFHDRLGFERVGESVAPDGESGMIWRKVL